MVPYFPPGDGVASGDSNGNGTGPTVTARSVTRNVAPVRPDQHDQLDRLDTRPAISWRLVRLVRATGSRTSGDRAAWERISASDTLRPASLSICIRMNGGVRGTRSTGLVVSCRGGSQGAVADRRGGGESLATGEAW